MLKNIADIIKKLIYWPLFCLVAITAYGYLIVTYTYGVNDEVINYYVYDTNLVAQDRIGIYLFNKIFHCYDLLPFWGEMIGLIFLCIAAIVWVYTIDACTKRKLSKGILTLFCCALISFPYIGKCAIWRGLLAQTAQVLLFAALYSCCYYYYLTTREKKYILFAFFWGTIALFFDKAYVTTLILGGGFVFLNYIRTEKKRSMQIACDALNLIFLIFAMVFGDLIIVFAIQKMLNVTPTHYVNTYFRYSQGNIFIQILNFIPALIKKFYNLAKITWSGKAIYVSVICTFLIGIFELIKSKSIWYFLINIGLVIDCGLIYIITGNLWMPERSVCHVLSLFVALFVVNFFIVFHQYLERLVIIKYFIVCILGLVIANFSFEMEQIFYAKYMSFEKDKAILDELMKDIYIVGGYNTQKPIIFMGVPNDMITVWPPVENASVFSWGRLERLEREENSRLLYGFINDNGYNVTGVPKNIDFVEIRKKISNMQNWPQEDSIKEFKEYILVKLGDSNCEIIEMPREQFINCYIVNDPDIILNQNKLEINGSQISLGGWIVHKGENAYTNNISLALVSNNSSEHYKIRVNETINRDISLLINDGFNYDNSGYKMDISLSSYIKSGTYDLMLILEVEHEKYLVSLGEQITIE